MLNKRHNLSNWKQSYSDIDSFLEEIKNELICNYFSDHLALLKEYRQEQRTEPITLIFDNCILKLPGTDDVAATINRLEYLLNEI